MEKQQQYFQIADLIFSSDINTPQPTQEELRLIREKFEALLDTFTTDATHYSTNFIKKGKTNLPYNSFTAMGRIGEYTILNFTSSFSSPLLFVIDAKRGVAKNYFDIQVAKTLLNDIVYENVRTRLLSPKMIDGLFKNISDINKFVEKYREVLLEHNNPNCVTGRECFEFTI